MFVMIECNVREIHSVDNYFVTYETEFVLILAVLENSVLPMG